MAKIKGKWIEDATIAESKLDIANTPTNGYIMSWSDSEGKPIWITPTTADAHDFKVSVNDTTPGFLEGKLLGTANVITLTVNNEGGNETLTLNAGSNLFNKSTNTSDNITQGSTNLFLTSAERTKLANTTNTNSGDITVTDSTEIDFTLTGQELTASLKSASIDESKLDVSVNASLDKADNSVQKSGNETIAGVKTFTSFPVTPSLAPTTDYQTANKKYVDDIIKASDAMVYKGATDCSTNPNYPAGNAGDTYKVSVAGKIGGSSGLSVEVGDMYICTTDGSAAGTQATVGANWNVLQVNLDGVVIGPTSAVSGNIVSYNGVSGKLVQDSGFAVTNLFNKSTHTSDNITQGTTNLFLTTSERTKLSNTSGTNTGDEVVATGAEVNTGSDNTKYISPKALADSKYITSDGTETLTNKTFNANGTGNSITNIDVADLANGTAGQLITWNASGAPTTVAVGTANQILTSNGAGQAPTFKNPPAGSIKKVEIITLSATNITNKYVDLIQIPIDPTAVEVCPVGGIPQTYTADFTVISNGTSIKRLNWSTLGMFGILSEADKLIVSYTY